MMLERMSFGSVPAKHHIAHHGATGDLLWEECLTRQGFDGPYTILYHEKRPHEFRSLPIKYGWRTPRPSLSAGLLSKRHFRTPELSVHGGAALNKRIPMLFNEDICVNVLFPDSADPAYLNNGDSDELFYIHQGGGVLRTLLGDLKFSASDYVYVPKGLLHRFIPDGTKQHWLNIQCHHGLSLPKQWRNQVGQLRMDAPYCHRDFRRPEFQGPVDEGIREIVVKRKDQFHGFTLPHNPMDVVGWDGSVYPWVFPILHFQPRVGQVHLPPSWHGTFSTQGALICSFVPRLVDFHPKAVSCPYPHSSVDCDELIFYCHGNFTSREGVSSGSMSYHPMGIPHGPHPGAYEGSVGEQTTSELAVMIDTFKPLQVDASATQVEDPDYDRSFCS